MANVRVNESGKRIRYITSFDMSSNTSLSMKIRDPSGNESTDITATLGTTTTTDENGDTVAANEWMYFDTDAADANTLFDETGTWYVVGQYTNTATSPDDIFTGGWVAITVEEGY